MTARLDEAAQAEIAIPPEAEQAAQVLAAQARAIAASVPFGTDPAEFLATLERLAGEEEDVALPAP